MAVKAKIVSTYDDKGTKKAKKSITGLERHTLKAAKRIGAALIAAFALHRIKAFFSSSLQAFGIQEKAVSKLRAVLENAGEDADKLIPKYEALAASLQGISDHGDEAILSVMALGRSMGLTGQNLEDATKAAVGLAQGFDMSLESAMRNIAKLQGNLAGELGELIPELKDATTAQDKMNIVFKIGAARLRESEQLSDTYARKVEQARMKWGDFTEKVGSSLVEFMETHGVLDKIISLLDKMNAMDFSSFASKFKNQVLGTLWEGMNMVDAIMSGLGFGDRKVKGKNPYKGKDEASSGATRTSTPRRRPPSVEGVLQGVVDNINRDLRRMSAGSFSDRVGRSGFANGFAPGSRFGTLDTMRSGFRGAGPRKDLSYYRGLANDIQYRSLSGADLFDTLAGARKTGQQLGEKGNPMFVHVENNPTVGTR